MRPMALVRRGGVAHPGIEPPSAAYTNHVAHAASCFQAIADKGVGPALPCRSNADRNDTVGPTELSADHASCPDGTLPHGCHPNNWTYSLSRINGSQTIQPQLDLLRWR